MFPKPLTIPMAAARFLKQVCQLQVLNPVSKLTQVVWEPRLTPTPGSLQNLNCNLGNLELATS